MEPAQCFISYCWLNSHDAVSKGTKKRENALGWEESDPRSLCKKLQKAGITCWLDTERSGIRGLFEDISQGLQECRVLVVCVSKEYKDSKNCMMEMRYGTLQLNKPVVYVIVGQGLEWKYSELGMLMQRCRGEEILLQRPEEDSEAQMNRFIKATRDATEKGRQQVAQSRSTSKNDLANQFGSLQRRDTAESSFQEESELAQRRFLKTDGGFCYSHPVQSLSSSGGAGFK